jgi:hypothetical protein
VTTNISDMKKKEIDHAVDFLGNELRVGDKIVFAKSEHSSLAIGEITKFSGGNAVTYAHVKIIIAPFAGYWKEAVTRIGEETKVQLTKRVEETHHRKETQKEDGTWNLVVDFYDTDYVYALKWTGDIPDKPQYNFLRTEPR